MAYLCISMSGIGIKISLYKRITLNLEGNKMLESDIVEDNQTIKLPKRSIVRKMFFWEWCLQ